MVIRLLLIVSFLMLVAGRTFSVPVNTSDKQGIMAFSKTESFCPDFSVNEDNIEKSGKSVQDIPVYPVINDQGRSGNFQNTRISVYNRIEHSCASCLKTLEAEAINKSPLVKNLRI